MSPIDNYIVTVSIVNFNTSHLLDDCVSSIKKYIPSVKEIVVINHSHERIRLKESSHITLLSQENKGFGSGHNYAITHLSKKYTGSGKNHIHLFLNPDTILTQSFAHAFIYFKDADIAVVGPQLIDKSNNRDCYSAGFSPSFFRAVIGKICKPILPKRPTSVDWISGAAMLVRFDDFLHINGFDEEYFLYFEDADLCYRIKNYCHKKVLFDPKSTVIHIGGQSFSSTREQKNYYDTSQDRYFCARYSLIHVYLQRIFRSTWRALQ